MTRPTLPLTDAPKIGVLTADDEDTDDFFELIYAETAANRHVPPVFGNRDAFTAAVDGERVLRLTLMAQTVGIFLDGELLYANEHADRVPEMKAAVDVYMKKADADVCIKEAAVDIDTKEAAADVCIKKAAANVCVNTAAVPFCLETERLILRELTHSDYDALYAVLADSDIMSHYPYTFDEARVRNWIERNIERYRTFGFGLWAVVLRESGEMIGDCGVTMQNIDGFIRPELGYHIAAAHQRHGYAKEAAVKCRDCIFEHTPFNELYSYMPAANVPSSATAMSAGMTLACEYDNNGVATSVYSITRERWEIETSHE